MSTTVKKAKVVSVVLLVVSMAIVIIYTTVVEKNRKVMQLRSGINKTATPRVDQIPQEKLRVCINQEKQTQTHKPQ